MITKNVCRNIFRRSRIFFTGFTITVSLTLTLLDAGAAPYALVHAFAGSPNDGANPSYGSSLIASGSTFYGVTQNGGTGTNGVLFKINSSGTGLQVVHSFNGFSPLSPNGSKNDGARPYGSPLLLGATLYGTTLMGGSNGFGTVYKVNVDGSGFQVLHHFGYLNDGSTPYGSLVFDGTSLFGFTQGGGMGSEGIIFKISTNGTGYQVMHNFTANGTDGLAPWGSPVLSGSILYGMTIFGGTLNSGTAFRIGTDGTGYQLIHTFTGVLSDGSHPYGSLTVDNSTLYGMTSDGGTNNAGTVFQMQTNGTAFKLLHSFALSEAYSPFADLALSGSSLYGFTHSGVTNYLSASLGSGSVFQINTNGTGYEVLHTFLFPINATDGSMPFGSPLVLGSKLYGMTQLGGSTSPDAGCIFSIALSGGSGGSTPPSITTASPLPDGIVGATYSQTLSAVGGTTPYTWAIASGHLPAGLSLSTGGVISGKPAAATTANFSVKVTEKTGLSATNIFSLTIVPAPDVTDPVVVIVAPKNGLRVSNDFFTATGTAKDNVALAGVYYQINGSGWFSTATLNNWTNWSATNLVLLAGTNTFSAYAVDTSTNFSTTNTLKFVYVLSDRLAVLVNGAGTFAPSLNGQTLEIGKNYSLTAKPAKGFGFVNWTSDAFTNPSPTLTFTMKSNLVITANFLDVTRPVDLILAPKANQRWSNSVFTVTGKATDNVAVSNVFVQVNNTGWSNAVTLNHWTNWSADIALSPGSNIVSSYAMDLTGNLSLSNTIKFTYVLTGYLSVSNNGSGNIAPNLGGKPLEIGKTYSMTATAGKGFAFVNWTGSLTSNIPKLTFVMESNLVFIANFADVMRPVAAILNPKAGQIVTNPAPIASGKASDNVGVSNVWYQINGGAWDPAAFAVDGTNWTTPGLLPFLVSGSNTVSAFALDGAGNVSLTNTVRFKYVIQPVADWAPDSLNGLLAFVTPSNAPAERVGFDLATFAQSSSTNSDDGNDYGVGTYTYTKTDTNMALLSLAFTAPPTKTNDTVGPVGLVFTSHYSGYFTNTGGSGDNGGFTVSIPTNLVPASLSGKTLTAVNDGSGGTTTIKLVNGTSFTKSPANNGGAGVSSGTYTLTRFSPVAALLTFTFTSPADAGQVAYVQATFTNATSGTYFVASFNAGVLQDSGTGRFTVK